jgi:hypothetical protein
MSTTPVASPTPNNNVRYKPYKKYTSNTGVTQKRKKRLFIQAGTVPEFTPQGETRRAFEIVNELQAALTPVFLPTDETGALNNFLEENLQTGLKFCGASARSGGGVGTAFSKRSVKNPLDIVLTVRRVADNLRSTQAFMTFRVIEEANGEKSLYINLLCAKNAPEIDNTGAYLVSLLFYVASRMGIPRITLKAVKDRVGYYKHLGFQVTPGYDMGAHPVVHMFMEVPEPAYNVPNYVFEENANNGFVENYSAPVAAAAGGAGEEPTPVATTAAYENEPEGNNVWGGNKKPHVGPSRDENVRRAIADMGLDMRRGSKRRQTRRKARV